MKFSGKTNKLFMGGTVGFSVVLSGLLLNSPQHITKVAVAQIAQALSPEEINLRAKQIIVRIDGASVGSGSLIESSDNVYTVLTNWHVMKNQGEYVVSTIDGRKHQVDPASIKQLPGLDLAILKFTSNQNYQVAELGDSGSLNEGQSVYFAGYPGELRREDNRYYRFFSASLVGILPKATQNGYSLVYNGEAFPGMSGGPVFNRDGLVIGVHGEANVHALSGGTSNYAIPIDTYQTAITNLDSQPTAEKPTTETPKTTETTQPSADEADITTSQPTVEPEKPSETDRGQSEDNPDNISSVPTFTPDSPPGNSSSEAPNSSSANSEAETPSELEATNSSATNNQAEALPEAETTEPPAPEPEPKPEVESETIEVTTTTTTMAIPLVSEKTGIDFTPLRNLLKEGKWSEADLKTYKLVEEVVKTAKQKNKHIFIELKTIAEFSCPDIRTIDALWKKYTGNKFGFSSQQEVWQSVNQKGDFSTETWRSFATQVGWKKGDVKSGSGYLLYDELDFNPTKAPTGHLPWWFALPDEEQKVIKHLFARCNFNPTPQELAAEEGKKPQKPAKNSGDRSKKPDRQPAIDKNPK